MRTLQSLALVFAAASATWALPTLPITFQDELDSVNPADVIGNPALFDIDNLKLVSLTGNTLQVDIRFNFGGGTSLTGFTIPGFTPTLNVGDLFFRTPANTYAVILHGHDGLAAHGLYRISDTQSSASVLGNPAGSYRPTAQVWASATGAQLLTTGSAIVNTVGGEATSLLASLQIQLNNTILADLDNGFSLYFASATCGNDEVTGTVAASVPEPGTWALLGAGLMGLGLMRRKR